MTDVKDEIMVEGATTLLEIIATAVVAGIFVAAVLAILGGTVMDLLYFLGGLI